MRFCLGKCQEAAYAISGRPAGKPGNEVEHALDDLVGWLNLIRIDDFVEAGLHEALTSVIDRIHEIGDAIHRTYFDQRASLSRRRTGRRLVRRGRRPPSRERRLASCRDPRRRRPPA